MIENKFSNADRRRISRPVCLLLPLAFCLSPMAASALEKNYGDWSFKLSGYGTLGAAAARDDGGIVKDWRLRGQAGYEFQNKWTGGFAYSIDQWEIDRKHFADDAFMFLETPLGRAELGVTDGIATKLSLGLPDVGGLRINKDLIAYEFADPSPSLSGTALAYGGGGTFRANMASSPKNPVQFGFSYAPRQRHFDNAADFGIKFKNSGGKTKTALSLGASFIDRPDGLLEDLYAPRASADWRAQVSFGANVQYNSWNFGATAKAIYDRNPAGAVSDGFSVGAGASYDFLSFSVSASYLGSAIGALHGGADYFAHTGILSARYKINRYLNIWISGGAVSSIETSAFISGGANVKF